MAGRYHPSHNDGIVKNPLASLVRCANCGGNMQRMTFKRSQQSYLLCVQRGCCASAKIDLVEARVLDHLQDILNQIDLERPEHQQNLAPLEDAVAAISSEMASANRQKSRLHDLLETGEYDLPTYRERMAVVKDRLASLELQLKDAQLRLDQAKAYNPAVQASNIRAVLDAYCTSDAAHKNALLHSVIEVVTYHKEKKTKPADFELEFIMKSC